ncbi:MAG: iron-sulfur cluster insertion protein ErpA [Xanthomonadales bacterium]|nr:iron-sulfur cluster insertion protein ErpA [Xanthomonadales bacterium]
MSATLPSYRETGTALLTVTPAAAARVRALIEAEGEPGLMLRVYIQGGGCSGFQYGFAFEREREEEDLLIEQHGLRVLIDPLSLQYLEGAEIDYREDLMGAQFVVRNPNATTTCGCGSSFAV